MLSGITRCVAPLRSGTPSISSTSVPIPWIRAPILPRNVARSTTCGSRAALWMVVMPSAVAAAIIRFSVPVTVGMSRKMVASFSRSARATYSPPSSSILAPIRRSPRRCCSTRRMPISSPPGFATRASPRRASSGPQKRKGGAHRPCHRRQDLAAGEPLGVDLKLLRIHPANVHAHALQQANHGRDVLDPRHVLEADFLLGEEAGGEDGKDRVLGATDRDPPDQSSSPLDQELGH